MITARTATGADYVETATTDDLRSRFLLESLFERGEFRGVYLHDDRLVVAGAVPAGGELLPSGLDALGVGGFLDVREAGVINLGDPGEVVVDGVAHTLGHFDALYAGRGTEISFRGDGARFYLVSALAHVAHPTLVIPFESIEPVVILDPRGAGGRRLFRYVWGGGHPSCQLQFGLTMLDPRAVWNTLPPHRHPRRTEVYLYTDVPADSRVMHFLGEPDRTRHVVVADGQAVIAPPWSLHMGVGTAPYNFVWAMAGENTDYGDTDPVSVEDLR